jgi:F420-0:Gamma-glutamyl ligase
MIPLPVHEAGLPDGLVAIPIRTRLVGPGDDLGALVDDAVRGIARPDDVIVIAETAVAIAQRRFVPAEFVRPSRLAFALSARAGALATMSQPESAQIVIDQVGAGTVVYAAIAHVLGRFVGRRGVFYEILGEAIAAIDGYTGTLPPYERAIVFGPAEPDAVCAELTQRLHYGFAIVDANDLRKAKALGVSPGLVRAHVELALLGNPHGNSDEQTPLVILTWRGSGTNPLREAA